MRYHWGHAIGHMYAYDTYRSSEKTVAADRLPDEGDADVDTYHSETERVGDDGEDSTSEPEGSESSEEDDGDERDAEGWDDEELLAMHEMYGGTQDIEYYE